MLDALDDLVRRQPDYPKSEGLRLWAKDAGAYTGGQPGKLVDVGVNSLTFSTCHCIVGAVEEASILPP